MKFVINLIKTSQGYSLLQGDVEVNRSTAKTAKDKSYSLSKKFAQQNFTIYPYISNKEADNHKYILIPARTHWFNLNSVHQIQKKALPEWFKIKKGILATMNNIKFEKHEELYKKYRNYIIDLGKQKYITPSESRKGLAGDACAIIRIHKFLQKWGLINFIHKKQLNNIGSSELQQKQQSLQGLINKRKDCFDRDKLIVSRSYGKDDLELLKKITKKFRSVCHFCEGICGVVWYEFKEKFVLKKFVDAPGKQGRIIQNSQKMIQYSLIICASCFFEGNVPLILSPNDFVKKTVLDDLGEQGGHDSQKKKNNEQNKVAQAIQKNKFKINKTAEQVKMTPEHVFRILMTMPIQKLQKISRIQAETDAETEQVPSKTVPIGQKHQKKMEEQNVKQSSAQQCETLQSKIKHEVQNLESEGREAYEKFFQSWLLKINSKLQRLKQWQNGVQAKFKGIMRLQKNLLAQKIQLLSKDLAN